MSSPIDQADDLTVRFRAEIEWVKGQVATGTPASQIANSLLAKRLGNIEIIFIAREATGVSLGKLKAFGQWWSHSGVTDANQFDAWAAQVLRP